MALVRKYFLIGLLLSILLGGLFAFLGVYNTDAQPYFNRFVFWTSTMIVGLLSTGLITPLVFNRFLANRHISLQLSAIIVLISFPVTLVLAGFDHNYGSDWSAYHWFIQYRYVIVISAILIIGGYIVLRAYGFVDVTPEEMVNDGSPEAKFLKRLPLQYRQAKLTAITSEDHYLRVFTDQGETLILMRMSDALLELESASGMQTHRSWWVANSAIADAKRNQGKLTLVLKSGQSVPVSRSFDKAVSSQLANAL